MAVQKPATAPATKNTNTVPSQWSSQKPSNAGRVISRAIDVIREVHWIALAKGEKSCRCGFTSGRCPIF
jgi:hypothetical protein